MGCLEDKLLSAIASAGATIEPLDIAEILTATTDTSVQDCVHIKSYTNPLLLHSVTNTHGQVIPVGKKVKIRSIKVRVRVRKKFVQKQLCY